MARAAQRDIAETRPTTSATARCDFPAQTQRRSRFHIDPIAPTNDHPEPAPNQPHRTAASANCTPRAVDKTAAEIPGADTTPRAAERHRAPVFAGRKHHAAPGRAASP